jgi:hypothetical protein
MIPILALTVFLRQFLLKNSEFMLIVLGLTMGISILWSYESFFGVIAAGLVVALTVYKNKLGFRKIILFLAVPMFLTLALPLIFLGIFDDFILGFGLNTSGYLEAWAGVISLTNGPLFNLLLFFVPICIMVFNYSIFKELFSKTRTDQSLLWIAPSLASVMIYYVKFLAWPDWHLAQSSSVLLFLLIFYSLSRFSKRPKVKEDRFLVIIFLFAFLNFIGIAPGN